MLCWWDIEHVDYDDSIRLIFIGYYRRLPAPFQQSTNRAERRAVAASRMRGEQQSRRDKAQPINLMVSIEKAMGLQDREETPKAEHCSVLKRSEHSRMYRVAKAYLVCTYMNDRIGI